MLGGSVEDHIDHARALAALIAADGGVPRRLLDLGSGAGVPGLVLAVEWPQTEVVLLDAAARRARWLRSARETLGVHAVVLEGRGEALAHEPSWRGAFDVVTARAFGSPAVTAEIGGAFLASGGRLVVTDPPDADAARWPTAELAELGLTLTRTTRQPVAASVLTRGAPPPERFPRRVGVPAKRPLW